MKNNQNVCLANDSHYKVMKNLSIEYVIADEIIKSLFFVYISLATLTSLNCNVENCTKAWYVDETDSYHFFLNFEIKSKNFMKFILNHRMLCKTISKYIIKRLLHLYGNILWATLPKKLVRHNSFHISAIT